MQKYYNRRAQEYEQKYHRDEPVRRFGAGRAATRRTEVAAQVAQQIVATDTSREMMALAYEKALPPDKVEFRIADAYDLSAVPGEFDGGLAMFWFSHVPKARVEQFLRGFHAKLSKGAVAFMADDVYIPGVGGEFITREGTEDTFKLRELSDGSKHEIIKNYYDAEGLRRVLAPHATDVQVHIGQCHWWVSYVVL